MSLLSIVQQSAEADASSVQIAQSEGLRAVLHYALSMADELELPFVAVSISQALDRLDLGIS